MPMRQPQMTPTTAPPVAQSRTTRICACAGVKLGPGSRSFSEADSTIPPKRQPLVSETTLPSAAAVRVERPK
eukprot:4836971-Prymnesium_polylepis.1